MPPEERITVEVEGRELSLSNLSKVLFPKDGFTKAQVLDYYRRVAPAMLPHLRGRPATFTRYPDGTSAMSFFAKNCPPGAPPWLPTARIVSETDGTITEHCVIEDLPALMWAANIAAFEIHVPLSTAADIHAPTAVVFDLDPGEPAGIVECAQVALLVRDLLDELGLTAVVKTSGSKGLQAYLPLNTPTSYADTRAFSQAIALILSRRHPSRILAGLSKPQRRGRVLVDWNQNHHSKTMVAPYSLRGQPDSAVSTPLAWDEVEVIASGSGKTRWMASELPDRIDERGDLFAPMLTLEQRLPEGVRA